MASLRGGGAMLLFETNGETNQVAGALTETKLTELPSVPFGERLIRLRKDRDLTLLQLGAKVGVSTVTIWNWENGTRYPRRENMQRLANALQTSVPLLAGEKANGELHLLNPSLFGQRLAVLRRVRKLSLAQLGERLAVSNVCIWKWEKGQTLPKPDKLRQLAETLQTSVLLLTCGCEAAARKDTLVERTAAG
jgi:transcriptional regulator with XRE-family HTH domain